MARSSIGVGALAFVARRLKDERIGLLVARRLEVSAAPGDLERALAEGRLGRLRLASLEPTNLDRLLATRLDARLSEQSLARLH